MNPNEPPETADERIPSQRRRKLIVALSLAVAAGMIIGGMVTFFMVRIQATRARQAAEVAQQQAREAVLKSESEQNSSAP